LLLLLPLLLDMLLDPKALRYPANNSSSSSSDNNGKHEHRTASTHIRTLKNMLYSPLNVLMHNTLFHQMLHNIYMLTRGQPFLPQIRCWRDSTHQYPLAGHHQLLLLLLLGCKEVRQALRSCVPQAHVVQAAAAAAKISVSCSMLRASV
jgi:hypothetical protein